MRGTRVRPAAVTAGGDRRPIQRSQEAWMVVSGVILIVGAVIGQAALAAFGFIALLASGIAKLWDRLALEDVHYERLLSQKRAFIGDVVPMTLALTNRKPLPLPWVQIEDPIGEGLEVVEGNADVGSYTGGSRVHQSVSMAWYERTLWDYKIRPTKRGLLEVGPVTIESGDPFGFTSEFKNEYHKDTLLVYPRMVSLGELGIPSVRPLGEVRGGLRIYPDPSRPVGLRDYVRGDPLKWIDWKATARFHGMQVRQYDPSTATTVVLVVAVDTGEPHWETHDPDELERVILAAAAIAGYAAENEYVLGLFANDMRLPDDGRMTVPPRHGREHLSEILAALAMMKDFAVAPMAEHLSAHSRVLPAGATLVVTAGFIPEDFVTALAELKRRGHKIVVLYTGKEPCPVLSPGITVYEIREHILKLESQIDVTAG